MSRDGLVPKAFTKIHPVLAHAGILDGVFRCLYCPIAAFTPINIVGSLTNMGTLFAFILVSIAVPILRKRHPDLKAAFNVPFGRMSCQLLRP